MEHGMNTAVGGGKGQTNRIVGSGNHILNLEGTDVFGMNFFLPVLNLRLRVERYMNQIIFLEIMRASESSISVRLPGFELIE